MGLVIILFLPGVIAHYFVKTVELVGGYPEYCRTDCGSENVTVAALQSFVNNRYSAHIYGSSPSNQRIEAWWSFYRCSRSQWWMEFFAEFVSRGIYHIGHPRETDCLRFCFMNIIRLDLQQVAHQWNTHRIRPSRSARCPAGIPDQLYFTPSPPAVDCLNRVHVQLPAEIQQHIHVPTTCSDPTFGAYLLHLCQRFQWAAPSTAEEAVTLYNNLYSVICQ